MNTINYIYIYIYINRDRERQRDRDRVFGEGASLVLVGHTSSHGVTMKMYSGVDVLHQPALRPIHSY